jgi:hypothetical protein
MSCQHCSSGVLGSDIGCGWMRLRSFGPRAAKRCDRSINSVELIHQFAALPFEHAHDLLQPGQETPPRRRTDILTPSKQEPLRRRARDQRQYVRGKDERQALIRSDRGDLLSTTTAVLAFQFCAAVSALSHSVHDADHRGRSLPHQLPVCLAPSSRPPRTALPSTSHRLPVHLAPPSRPPRTDFRSTSHRLPVQDRTVPKIPSWTAQGRDSGDHRRSLGRERNNQDE